MTTDHQLNARTPIAWWECEPRRLHRDQEEITTRFPDLAWKQDEAGTWEGRLPRWPFDRPEPAHLTDWTSGEGLLLRMECHQAYPMVAPRIIPLDPRPQPFEWTQHRWHVNGDASLCLLREAAAWTGRESAVDLLLKAAGWRIEYALMKHNMIDEMTANGIVSDDRLDHLLAGPPAPDGSRRHPAPPTGSEERP
ncbi:hypothetical protein GTY65_33885 [Streptomyces sp. SID8379]|uniref:hypothetical protein n=1 Tax=unclassified Streptomyces TaxID=2593676 RepID=UPI000361F683|nr:MULTISPECIES: hypothetical protein [unclassified Streptomyces]MYW69030.1 hypothetical protein [Streptomyces sp. SID8379]